MKSFRICEGRALQGEGWPGTDPGAAETRTDAPGSAVGIGLGAAAKKGDVHVALRTGTGGRMW
jgi:hypothetical protein